MRKDNQSKRKQEKKKRKNGRGDGTDKTNDKMFHFSLTISIITLSINCLNS